MNGQPGSLLRDLCTGAQRLLLAAPYIKVDVLDVVLSRVAPEASFICVTRWNPRDLAVGASDIECRTMVTQFGGSFRLHTSLHAKYYRIDDTVLIGSANLTSSAMGWASQSNLEILCRAGDDFDAWSFEQNLLKHAREVSDWEFLHWQEISKICAQGDQAMIGGEPKLDTWRPATRDPRHFGLIYQGREDEIASQDEHRAARRDIQALSIPSGLTVEQVRIWASTSLLAAPFTNSVIQLLNAADAADSYNVLAETYGLSMTEARRDMETVQNWLAFFAPEVLRQSE